MSASLANIATSTLDALHNHLRRAPHVQTLSAQRLSRWGLSHSTHALQMALEPLPREAWVPLLGHLLEARRHNEHNKPELVWTGPAPHHGRARQTRVLLQQLFAQAHREVLLAGYSFDHGHLLFAPLFEAMNERSVQARFYLHLQQDGTQATGPLAMPPVRLQELVRAFAQKNWPFGAPYPRFFVDSRLCTGQRWHSLHAKCAVIDGTHTLMTSANFTRRGQHDNVEAGVLLHDKAFADLVLEQFQLSTRADLFLEVFV